MKSTTCDICGEDIDDYYNPGRSNHTTQKAYLKGSCAFDYKIVIDACSDSLQALDICQRCILRAVQGLD